MQATGGYQQRATGGYKAHRSLVHRVLVSTSNSKVHMALVRRALVAASSKTPAGTEQDTRGTAIYQQDAHGTHWHTGHRWHRAWLQRPKATGITKLAMAGGGSYQHVTGSYQ